MKLNIDYNDRKQVCRSREGAWIEIISFINYILTKCVAPVRERGLKYFPTLAAVPVEKVAPVRERGLKYCLRGARCWQAEVAPVRERGLKLNTAQKAEIILTCRSREGAWIEI